MPCMSHRTDHRTDRMSPLPCDHMSATAWSAGTFGVRRNEDGHSHRASSSLPRESNGSIGDGVYMY
jgi:hypothetical protein